MSSPLPSYPFPPPPLLTRSSWNRRYRPRNEAPLQHTSWSHYAGFPLHRLVQFNTGSQCVRLDLHWRVWLHAAQSQDNDPRCTGQWHSGNNVQHCHSIHASANKTGCWWLGYLVSHSHRFSQIRDYLSVVICHFVTPTNTHSFAAFGVFDIIMTYFFIPDFTGRSYAQLDELFSRKIPARQFRTTVCTGSYGLDILHQGAGAEQTEKDTVEEVAK